MSTEQLVKAIGQAADGMLDETYTCRQSYTDAEPAVENSGTLRTSRGKYRVSTAVVLIALIVLIGGSMVLASGIRGGNLKKNEESANNSEGVTYEFTPYESSKIPITDFHGEIMESAVKNITERIEKWGKMDWFERASRSDLPDHIVQYFETPEEALQYIGCDRIAMPELDYEYTDIHVGIEGDADYLPDFVVKDIKICGISYETTQEYHSDPDCFFQSIAILRTEYSKQDAGIRLGVDSDFDREKTIVKTVNGREFSYLQLDYDKDTHLYYQGAIDVLWAENGVTYYFHMVYYDNCREKAEQIAEEWMESFR